jgi:hypothetical protein
VQPSLNYNLEDGWYLLSAPQIGADWRAESGQKWTVPIGGGIGRVFSAAGQDMSLSLETYWYAEHPDEGPEWIATLTFTVLFPN